eukprot:scaffold54311_cov63-Phaeocystis_antarctica.AAC.9
MGCMETKVTATTGTPDHFQCSLPVSPGMSSACPQPPTRLPLSSAVLHEVRVAALPPACDLAS